MWKDRIADTADRRLAARAVAGDREAGEEFVRRHYTGVYGFVLALTHCRDAAEELTQATFIETWKSLHSFGGHSSLRTWVHRIAYRQYSRWCESRARRTVDEVEETRKSHELSVVDSVWLHAAIETLPPDLRDTFVLFYVQDLSTKEVADVLGLPKGTVLSRLHAARDRLRRHLTANDPTPDAPGRMESPDLGGTRYEMREASV